MEPAKMEKSEDHKKDIRKFEIFADNLDGIIYTKSSNAFKIGKQLNTSITLKGLKNLTNLNENFKNNNKVELNKNLAQKNLIPSNANKKQKSRLLTSDGRDLGEITVYFISMTNEEKKCAIKEKSKPTIIDYQLLNGSQRIKFNKSHIQPAKVKVIKDVISCPENKTALVTKKMGTLKSINQNNFENSNKMSNQRIFPKNQVKTSKRKADNNDDYINFAPKIQKKNENPGQKYLAENIITKDDSLMRLIDSVPDSYSVICDSSIPISGLKLPEPGLEVEITTDQKIPELCPAIEFQDNPQLPEPEIDPEKKVEINSELPGVEIYPEKEVEVNLKLPELEIDLKKEIEVNSTLLVTVPKSEKKIKVNPEQQVLDSDLQIKFFSEPLIPVLNFKTEFEFSSIEKKGPKLDSEIPLGMVVMPQQRPEKKVADSFVDVNNFENASLKVGLTNNVPINISSVNVSSLEAKSVYVDNKTSKRNTEDLSSKLSIIGEALGRVDDEGLKKKALIALANCGLNVDHFVPVSKSFSESQTQTDDVVDEPGKNKVQLNKINYQKDSSIFSKQLEKNWTEMYESNAIQEKFRPWLKKAFDRIKSDIENAMEFDDDGFLPIHRSIFDDKPSTIKRKILIFFGWDKNIDFPSKDGRTCLELAVQYRASEEIIGFLLAKGANPTSKDNHNSALTIAAEQSLPCLINLINHTKADSRVNNYDSKGFTALHHCAINCNLEGIKELIKIKADVNVRVCNSGRTALFYAVQNKNLEIFKVLLSNKAKADVKNFADQTIFSLLKGKKYRLFKNEFSKFMK